MNELKYDDDGIRLTVAERKKILAFAKGLGAECKKHNIDIKTATDMVVLTMQETAKQLINDRVSNK